MPKPKDFLIIGPEGSGKSLLLKHIDHICRSLKGRPRTSCFPTNGVEPSTVVWNKVPLHFREIGGSYYPIWGSYFQNCAAVMYILDSSNAITFPWAWIHFLEVLNHKSLLNKAILLLFNKTDLAFTSERGELWKYCGMADLMELEAPRLEVLEISAVSGEGLNQVLQWIQSVLSQQAS